MSIIQATAKSGGATYNDPLANSFEFDGSTYLSRTPTSTGNQKKWTFSAWVKLSNTTGSSYLLSCDASSGNDGIAAVYFVDGKVHSYYDTTGTSPYGAVGSTTFTDTSVWYHVIWAVDAANTNHKIWINNQLISTDTSKYPPNYSYDMSRSGLLMAIGVHAWDDPFYFFDGFMANIQFIDGQFLDPYFFGESVNNIWVPYNAFSTAGSGTATASDGGTATDSYGTNGFHLDFADSSDIGNDVSGNNNDWTVN